MSKLNDEEILEIGADGSFNIPSPEKKKIEQTRNAPKPTPAPKPIPAQTPKPAPAPAAATAAAAAPTTTTATAAPATKTVPTKAPAVDQKDQVQGTTFTDVAPGEFKVYRNESTINIILCLEASQKVETVSMTETEVFVCIQNSSNEIRITLPVPILPNSATCRTHQNYVTIQASLVMR
jgi:hypothetical protein